MTQMKNIQYFATHLTSPTCQGNSPTAACVPPTILLEEELTPHWQLPEDRADYGVDAIVTIDYKSFKRRFAKILQSWRRPLLESLIN